MTLPSSGSPGGSVAVRDRTLRDSAVGERVAGLRLGVARRPAAPVTWPGPELTRSGSTVLPLSDQRARLPGSVAITVPAGDARHGLLTRSSTLNPNCSTRRAARSAVDLRSPITSAGIATWFGPPDTTIVITVSWLAHAAPAGRVGADHDARRRARRFGSPRSVTSKPSAPRMAAASASDRPATLGTATSALVGVVVELDRPFPP